MLELQLGSEDPLATRLEPRAEKGYSLLEFEPVYFWLECVDNRLADRRQNEGEPLNGNRIEALPRVPGREAAGVSERATWRPRARPSSCDE